MGRVGRGFARFIDPTEDVNKVAMLNWPRRLEAPLLTDIKINWGGLKANQCTPEIIPDLFKGDSLRIMARVRWMIWPRAARTPSPFRATPMVAKPTCR